MNMQDPVADEIRPGSKDDRRADLSKTTAAFSGTATGAIALIYTFQCIHEGHLVTPTVEQALALLGISGPFLHLLGRIIMAWTKKLLPDGETI